jgi:hypothetical protein
LIAGVGVYAVGARANQTNPYAELPAYVQTVDGRYIQVPGAKAVGFAPAPGAQFGYPGTPVGYNATPGYMTMPQAAPGYVTMPQAAPVVVQRQAPARVYRAAAPVQERVVVRETEARPQRSWAKTAMVVGGSAAGGAGVGGLVGGKKGALVGAAIGGGAASIYEATRRR